ncbi:glycosyltransferase family 4 protein [Pedomonas sp. V897]|uniref:glycosyltransferase family 4 protein n=1 Tax=Pedomonas sp. V897 TaxID=3446482 RepID=UPI003EE3E6EF
MRTRPRWLHIMPTFNLGGAETRTARLMNAFGDRVEHVVVPTLPGQTAAQKLLEPGVPVTFPDAPCRFKGPPLPVRLWEIGRFLRSGPFDLVLTYNWGAIEVAMANRLFARRPLVHHEDGFGPEEAHTTLPRRDHFRRLALPGAHAVVACSRRIESLALNQWGQPRARVRFIPNGVEIAPFDTPPAPDAIPGFVKKPGDRVVGTLAGLRDVKNLPRLVRAFAAAARGRENCWLVIGGQGPEEAAIRAEAAACGIAGRLVMPGYLKDPARYVGLFDVYAISSDTEQFPISLVEAMAARLPAVCTDVGDIARIIAPENAPFVVPAPDEAAFAAALATLLDDSTLRARIGAANRARVEAEFTQEKMVSAYARLYAEAQGRAF